MGKLRNILLGLGDKIYPKKIAFYAFDDGF